MTASRKFFMAAALLAAGFGVATLMGEPAARWHAAHSAAVERPQVAAFPKSSESITASNPARGVRLVPDFAATNPYQTQAKQAASVTAPALLPDAPDGSRTPPPYGISDHDDAPPAPATYAPRAKLRDEAPRPLAIERRADAPAVTGQMPLTNRDVANDSHTRSPADWQTSAFVPAGFSQDAQPMATIRASYSPPNEAALVALTHAPPPCPSPGEEQQVRTHIIVDGDSLERLAGRYLDDPRRSNEIFEANRELLASPDLLPIGAELIIPTQNDWPAIEAMSPKSSQANEVAIRAAAHNAMVPVRPIPSTAGVMPRAQLARPLPVE